MALGFTSLTFVVTLVVLGNYVNDSESRKPLQERATHNTLQRPGRRASSRSPTSRGGEYDLVVRRAWIPYFNIQYYLGVDGISLSLVVLTGLVSVLACLASWNIDKQVKGYFALYLLLVRQHDRRVHLARPVPVLRLLRGDAAADVLPDRHLGRAEAGVRRDQVPALHAVRLGLHPGRDPDPLLLAGRRDGAGLHGPFVRHRRSSRRSPARRAITRDRSSGGSSSCSSSASSSSCRRSRSTRGCPTRTSRRPRRSA